MSNRLMGALSRRRDPATTLCCASRADDTKYASKIVSRNRLRTALAKMLPRDPQSRWVDRQGVDTRAQRQASSCLRHSG
jgi:hypothetical protein